MNDKQQDREIIRDILQKIVAGYSPQKAILFGSLAYGQPDENSDIGVIYVQGAKQ